MTACCARYHGRGRGDSQYGMTDRRHPFATALPARSGCCRKWRPHRGHNGRLRTIGQLCCSIARKGVRYLTWWRLAGNDRGTSVDSFRRSFSVRRHSCEALPRTRSSALSPLGAIGREAKNSAPHQPSAGHPIKPNLSNLSPHKINKEYPRYTPSRSRSRPTAETELIEKARGFGRALCLRSMPTVGIIVGIGAGTRVGTGCR